MDTFLQLFMAPVITAVFVLLAQFFLTPHTEKKALIKKEMWLAKKDAFLDAMRVIDKLFDSVEWEGPTIPEKYVPSRKSPSSEEINKAHRNLMLLCDNIKIPTRFVDFFKKTKDATPTIRNEFIILLREELFNSKIAIKPEEVIYFYGKK